MRLKTQFCIIIRVAVKSKSNIELAQIIPQITCRIFQNKLIRSRKPCLNKPIHKTRRTENACINK